MKKIIAFTALALVSCSAIFAASYKNNTYQKLAKEYTIKAEKALDAGEYALAEEYAAKAKENADLSDAFISKMMIKENAENSIAKAKNRLEYVKSIHGAENFPTAVNAADTNYATYMARGIAAGTDDLTAGVSSLTSGCLYFVYE